MIDKKGWAESQVKKYDTLVGLCDYLLVEATLERVESEIDQMDNPDELDSILDSGLDTCREMAEGALEDLGRISFGRLSIDPAVLDSKVQAILSVAKGVHISSIYTDEASEDYLKIYRADNLVFLVFEVPSDDERRLIWKLVKEDWFNTALAEVIESIESHTSFETEVIKAFLEHQPSKIQQIMEDEGVFNDVLEEIAGSNSLQHLFKVLNYKIRPKDEVAWPYSFKEMLGTMRHKVYVFERPKCILSTKAKVAEEEEEDEESNLETEGI